MSDMNVGVKISADASGMNSGVSQSEAVLQRLVQEAQRSNAQLQQGFMQSTLALREIARASDEQRRGLEVIASAIHKIDQVTQSNASSSQNVAIAAETLQSAADELAQAATFLGRLVGTQA